MPGWRKVESAPGAGKAALPKAAADAHERIRAFLGIGASRRGDVDLAHARLRMRRPEGGLSVEHSIQGDELRAQAAPRRFEWIGRRDAFPGPMAGGEIMVEALRVPGCRVGSAAELGGGWLLRVERRRRGGCCPACGRPSRAGHGRDLCRPTDLPQLGRPVRLDPEVPRLRCANAARPRRVLAERVPSLVTPRARRTRRVAAGVKVGSGSLPAPRRARGGRERWRGPRAPPRCCGRSHAAPVPRVGEPRAVGIGGRAGRPGLSHGTLVVDRERRRPPDLRPDRSGPTLSAWLRRRPEIAVVARDRSTAVTRGPRRRPCRALCGWRSAGICCSPCGPGRGAPAGPLPWPPAAPARHRGRVPARPAPARLWEDRSRDRRRRRGPRRPR